MSQVIQRADKLTLDRIELMHPSVRAEVRELYLKANYKLGQYAKLRFSHTFRTPEEQHELFKKRPSVTNSDAWQSYHNYGLAFDIVILYDNDRNGTFEEASWNITRDSDKDGVADWIEVTRVFESGGWKNGFIRNGKTYDRPHFQKTNLHWSKLKELIDKGDYTVEVINGIEYKFVNLVS